MIKEILKSVPGYKGKYIISSFGRVYSNNYHRSGQRKEMMPSNVKGYRRVCLYNNGVKTEVRVHQLVARAFLKNPKRFNVINHIDGNKANNNVSNLEWCTISHNSKHAYDVLKRRPVCTGKYGGNHPASKRVVRIDKDGNRKYYNSQMDAAKDINRDSRTISSAIRGHHPTAGGYKWEYA